MLYEIDKNAVLVFTKVALNVILGTIPTDKQQLEKLLQHRGKLLELTKPSTSLPRHKGLLRKKCS